VGNFECFSWLIVCFLVMNIGVFVLERGSQDLSNDTKVAS
jgi:hypothetical protein